jgi:thioredoxin reductase
MKNKNIKIITNVNVVEIRGDKKVNSVVLDRKLGASNILQIDGVFVAIGTVPLSKLVQDIGVICNEKKEIITNHKTGETNVLGIYSAGDVSDIPYKQAIIGAAGGCIAARSAFEYLRK